MILSIILASNNIVVLAISADQKKIFNYSISYFNECADGGGSGGTATAGSGNYDKDAVLKFAATSVGATYDLSDDQVEKWFLSTNTAVISRYSLNESNIKEVTSAVRIRGVSPAFFYGYTVNEGGGEGGFINHYPAPAMPGTAVADAEKDADYIVTQTQSDNSSPAVGGGEPFTSTDQVPNAQKFLNSLSKGSIGKIYIPATSAATAEIEEYFGNKIGSDYYGKPIRDLMNYIVKMGGDPTKPGKDIYTGDTSSGSGGVGTGDTGTCVCTNSVGSSTSVNGSNAADNIDDNSTEDNKADAAFQILTTHSFSHNRNKPLNDVQAAAVLANMRSETNFDQNAGPEGRDANRGILMWESKGENRWGQIADPKGFKEQMEFLVKDMDSTGHGWYGAEYMDEFWQAKDEDDLKKALYSFSRNYVVASTGGSRTYPGNDEEARKLILGWDKGDSEGQSNSRWENAQAFYEKYKGKAGDSTNCSSTQGNGDIVKTAISLAWPDKNHYNEIKPEYKTALEETGVSTELSYAQDCGHFVATVMRYSGADKNFPLGDTEVMESYMASHPEKYTEIENLGNTSNLQPGDIFVVNAGGGASSGHIMLYIGDQGSDINSASASLGQRTGNLSSIKFSDGRGTYRIFRLK